MACNATLISEGIQFDSQPRFSPDGKYMISSKQDSNIKSGCIISKALLEKRSDRVGN